MKFKRYYDNHICRQFHIQHIIYNWNAPLQASYATHTYSARDLLRSLLNHTSDQHCYLQKCNTSFENTINRLLTYYIFTWAAALSSVLLESGWRTLEATVSFVQLAMVGAPAYYGPTPVIWPPHCAEHLSGSNKEDRVCEQV